ncbi:nitroreductase family protein [Oceanospirillum sediminis]|uniref:Nitroreductase family protein n=1 Tax=Oceanospirillum sediminis TaxID=2760088 RepID=A0A839INR1_9GAMM|nr:nitroreductase family protein [Oceanospirillum sediminis]MBB1486330.1 nitroreductase family protein [Oceanospirillum sediminis]
MNTIEAIYQRRAVKQFDPDFEISKEDELRLLEATIQAPTAYNIQHWRFLVLRDTEHRAYIRQHLGFNQSQMTDASLLILLTADTLAWQKSPERYWANTNTDTQQLMTGMINDFYSGREWLQRDEAQRSIGMAAQTLMLTAKEQGFDTCPLMGYDIEGVAEEVRLPEGFILGPMIAVGKAIKPAHPKAGQLPLDELVIENHF